MNGTMLWFNVDKGHGYIQTEEDERLFVAGNAFLPGHEPLPRCKGHEVTFELGVSDGEPCAVDVAFVSRGEPRRARLRRSRGGSSL